MATEQYNRVSVRHEDHAFSIYCTRYSLEKRQDEVIMWADKLARELGWLDYQMAITTATKAEAEGQFQALFENRFPRS